MESPNSVHCQDAKDYLTYLAINRRVAPATQNQAFNALLFLFRNILRTDFEEMEKTPRPNVTRRLPTVLDRKEIGALIGQMTGVYRLMAGLGYGAGLRRGEIVELRVQDIDFSSKLITVRCGKGDKDRTVMLPSAAEQALKNQIENVRDLHTRDLAKGYGRVKLPHALARKYPKADRQFPWQWLFPATKIGPIPEADFSGRHHLAGGQLQEKIREAAHNAGIYKKVGTHTLRHSFATHLLEDSVDIRTIQELLGHKSVETTMVYTHIVANRFGKIASPLDGLGSPDPDTRKPGRESCLAE